MDNFIELVRGNEVLYNVKCKEYKDQGIRNAAWEEISKEIKLPAEQCKEQWTKLRNAYSSALKRRRNKKSGQAAVNTTPWKYEEQMSFLNPHIELRPTITNLRSPPPSSTSTLSSSEDATESVALESPASESRSPGSPFPFDTQSNEPSRSRSPIKKKVDLGDVFTMIKKSTKLREERYLSRSEYDDTDHFFLSMSKAVKKLPELDRARIKFNLHKDVNEAEVREITKKQLTNSSIAIISNTRICPPVRNECIQLEPNAYRTSAQVPLPSHLLPDDMHTEQQQHLPNEVHTDHNSQSLLQYYNNADF